MPQHDDPKALGARRKGIIRPHCAQGRRSASEGEDSKTGKETMLTWVLIVLCFITAKANLGLIIGQIIVYKGTHKII